MIPEIGLKVLSTFTRTNMTEASATPMSQANLFWRAPTYSGTWLRTMSRPRTSVGA